MRHSLILAALVCRAAPAQRGKPQTAYFAQSPEGGR
jgi:hypothetical protein